MSRLNKISWIGNSEVNINFTLQPYNVEVLNLQNCEKLTDAGLCQILESTGPNLCDLYLSNTNISGEGGFIILCSLNGKLC